jgi:hypothetical protein
MFEKWTKALWGTSKESIDETIENLINHVFMLACLDISLLSKKMYGSWTLSIKCKVKP